MCPRTAPLLTGMVAHPRTHGGEGIRFPDNLIGVLKLPARNVRDVPPCFSANRTRGRTGRADKFTAYECIAPFLMNVPLEFVAEIPQSAQHGVRGRLSEPAHGCVLHHLCQLFQEFELLRSSLPMRNILENLKHALGAFAACEAFPARLILEETHEVLGHIDHARVVIHDDHAAGSHDRTRGDKTVIVDRKIEHARRNTPAGGSARLHSLDLRPPDRPSSDIVDNMIDRFSHRDFHQARVPDLAHQAEDLRPEIPRGTHLRVFLPTSINDDGNIRPGLHVVNGGGFPFDSPLDRDTAAADAVRPFSLPPT